MAVVIVRLIIVIVRMTIVITTWAAQIAATM